MYTLAIHTDDSFLLEYLNIESTRIHENTFSFSTLNRAVEVISQYIYLNVKSEVLSKIITGVKDYENEKESFLLFIPHEHEAEWRNKFKKRFHEYMETEQIKELHYEGFVTFRLNELKQSLHDYFQQEYLLYARATEPSNTLESLIDYMDSQKVKTDEIHIITFPNGDIEMQVEGNCVVIESKDSQENIIVQSVFAAPMRVRVFDNYDILKKESVLILKQLFGTKVSFEAP